MARYALSRSPRSIGRRLVREIRGRLARRADLQIARRSRVPRHRPPLNSDTVDGVWADLARRPYASGTIHLDPVMTDAICAGETVRVLAAAEDAVAHRVELLGSGPLQLGNPIDWLRDYKSGVRWELRYAPGHNFAELDRSTDVKFPWELSRLQWLIPAGQAYLLTGEDRFAVAVRDVIDEWITANPYALSVNWAIAMEPALRILTWTWFFHVFARSDAWTERGFRRRFLSALFAHGDFVERHLERADVNGNHFVADAAGLVFAGLFFGKNERAKRWATLGWQILLSELPRQVHSDGVDFESSTAYHRLVTELFLLPAFYRTALGLDVPDAYRRRLAAMGSFVATYSRSDGSAPLWGDADDGRALPFGAEPRNDHRYLVGLIASLLSDAALASRFSGSRSEILWVLGQEAAAALPNEATLESSSAFPEAGVYVMRQHADYVFIDCGSVGMAGRGGHGHNDCLSFELVLGGAHLLTDAGTYVYTASRAWRNRFRGTSAHNTPIVDDAEQNRLLHPDFLWTLRDDARPLLRGWKTGLRYDALVASHTGYKRLGSPVEPIRTFVLDKMTSRLVIRDAFVGGGSHSVRVPFHFPPSVRVVETRADRVVLSADERRFFIAWNSAADWRADVRDSWFSPSYGVKLPATCLELTRNGPLRPLLILISGDPIPENVEDTAGETLVGAGLDLSK
jgi:uncharacterized heparinase superfamily protein